MSPPYPGPALPGARQRIIIPPYQRIAFLAAAALLRSPRDSRFWPDVPGSAGSVRLLMSLAFGAAVAARGDDFPVPVPLGVWVLIVALATLLARLAAIFASAARPSVACRAWVAVTVPARAITTPDWCRNGLLDRGAGSSCISFRPIARI
jgi:hypothetical protein